MFGAGLLLLLIVLLWGLGFVVSSVIWFGLLFVALMWLSVLFVGLIAEVCCWVVLRWWLVGW